MAPMAPLCGRRPRGGAAGLGAAARPACTMNPTRATTTSSSAPDRRDAFSPTGSPPTAACRVLLVEAGHDARHFWLRLPVGYFRSIYDPRFSWQFPLEPEAATGARQVAWPRGKALGGSSVINGLLYIRGQPADFDDWAALHGARGWSYREVLPFFRRSEAYEGGASEWHGGDGELGVSDLRNDHPYCEAWLAAGAEAGYPLTRDFNGAQPDGLGRYQLTLRGRWRCDAATAFLAPVRARPNLTIATGAHVTRIVVEAGRARGIEWVDGGAPSAIGPGTRDGATGRAGRKARRTRRRRGHRRRRRAAVAAAARSSPASARRRCCSGTASPSRSIRPTSAATCRTITRRA